MNPETPSEASDISAFADVTKNGSGMWFIIHTMASSAVTEPLQLSCIHFIKYIQTHFKCQKCKGHFGTYIEKYPLENYLGLDNGIPKIFCWTVNLHNEVNKYLKKPIMSCDDAFKIYSDSTIGACFNCGAPDPSTDTPINTPGYRKPDAPSEPSIRPNPKPILVKIQPPPPFFLVKRV